MISALGAFISMWYPLLGLIAALSLFVWQHIKYMKWYNSPAQVALREKEAYDVAHAYTKGKCCCGRDKTED